MSALHWIVGVFVAAPALLRHKKERGDITLQQVIWAAGIAVAAVAVIAAIVAIINGYVARIPT
ncbi:hypothetical protein G7085_21045 [Tessaracoccus sp. HDW20]|uniref:hypothetical protein n=1 Tax=Tessaracoccus coleopterorum TaxID=2714950 RepID=UPI0018D40BC6|nr:hypothetical protein [Tessaracoccus coleopterorum]NHB86170.1 hypothetical protein [Tessaracoccus coleopterorum]